MDRKNPGDSEQPRKHHNAGGEGDFTPLHKGVWSVKQILRLFLVDHASMWGRDVIKQDAGYKKRSLHKLDNRTNQRICFL